MSKQKKHVYEQFLQDNYVPSSRQHIVKYISGKGNNLHATLHPSGATVLVSMPKKFRNTIWLRKNDCLVIEDVPEGKKVVGEIICVLPPESVIDLIERNQWPMSIQDEEKAQLISFFKKEERKRGEDTSPSSSEMSDSESD